MSRIRVIIQARVGSSRFPGKILAPLAGRPMLAHLVQRFRAAEKLLHDPPEGTLRPSSIPASPAAGALEILVATTRETADHATQSQCDALGVPCFRGPTRDVLARYVAASQDLGDNDLILRATADNPLYCPYRTVALVREHLSHEQRALRLAHTLTSSKTAQKPPLHASRDYTCIANLSYVVPEIIRAGAMRRMAEMARDEYSREHVTPFFRQTAAPFSVRQLPEHWLGLRPDVRLTVDTPAEHRRMARLFAELSRGDELVDLEAVYAWCDRHESSRGRVALPQGLAAWYSDAA